MTSGKHPLFKAVVMPSRRNLRKNGLLSLLLTILSITNLSQQTIARTLLEVEEPRLSQNQWFSMDSEKYEIKAEAKQ